MNEGVPRDIRLLLVRNYVRWAADHMRYALVSRGCYEDVRACGLLPKQRIPGQWRLYLPGACYIVFKAIYMDIRAGHLALAPLSLLNPAVWVINIHVNARLRYEVTDISNLQEPLEITRWEVREDAQEWMAEHYAGRWTNARTYVTSSSFVMYQNFLHDMAHLSIDCTHCTS
jgi:hypothetical protein